MKLAPDPSVTATCWVHRCKAWLSDFPDGKAGITIEPVTLVFQYQGKLFSIYDWRPEASYETLAQYLTHLLQDAPEVLDRARQHNNSWCAGYDCTWYCLEIKA